jgi:hypothetical protein
MFHLLGLVFGRVVVSCRFNEFLIFLYVTIKVFDYIINLSIINLNITRFVMHLLNACVIKIARKRDVIAVLSVFISSIHHTSYWQEARYQVF